MHPHQQVPTTRRGRAAAPASRVRRVALAAALVAAVAHDRVRAADIVGTEITINTLASNVTAISIPGSSQTVKVWFVKKTKNNPALEASVDIGVVRICGDTHISGSRFTLNVVADGIYARGARIRVAELDLCPD